MRAVFHIVLQRGKRDCLVACLASLLGLPYEETLIAAGRTDQRVWVRGLSPKEAIRVAKRLGTVLVYKDPPNEDELDEAQGILGITVLDEETGVQMSHSVVLSNGLIFDPQEGGSVWDASDYLQYYGATTVDFLQEQDL